MKLTKIISTLAAVTCTFASLSAASVQMYAADDITISVGSVTAEAGSEFSVDVEISNVPSSGIAGLEFAFKYDSSLVTVTSVTEGNISKTGASEAELDKNSGLADSAVNNSYSALSYDINTDEAAVNLIWLTGLGSDYYIKEDGVFVTINGKVNAGVSGKAELEIVPISRAGISSSTNNVYISIGDTGNEVVPSVKNGTVSISAGENSSDITTGGGSAVDATLLGDANFDGTIDIRDVTIMSQHIVKMVTLEGESFANGDINKDGIVDVKDLSQLKKYLINAIEKL